jgi:hypothetical protein
MPTLPLSPLPPQTPTLPSPSNTPTISVPSNPPHLVSVPTVLVTTPSSLYPPSLTYPPSTLSPPVIPSPSSLTVLYLRALPPPAHSTLYTPPSLRHRLCQYAILLSHLHHSPFRSLPSSSPYHSAVSPTAAPSNAPTVPYIHRPLSVADHHLHLAPSPYRLRVTYVQHLPYTLRYPRPHHNCSLPLSPTCFPITVLPTTTSLHLCPNMILYHRALLEPLLSPVLVPLRIAPTISLPLHHLPSQPLSYHPSCRHPVLQPP